MIRQTIGYNGVLAYFQTHPDDLIPREYDQPAILLHLLLPDISKAPCHSVHSRCTLLLFLSQNVTIPPALNIEKNEWNTMRFINVASKFCVRIFLGWWNMVKHGGETTPYRPYLHGKWPEISMLLQGTQQFPASWIRQCYWCHPDLRRGDNALPACHRLKNAFVFIGRWLGDDWEMVMLDEIV